MQKKTCKQYILSLLKFLVLFIFLLFVIFPFVWMFLTSIKTNQQEIYAYPVIYFTKNPSFENYTRMWTHGNFGRYFFNSFIAASIAGIFSVLIGILAGYVLARYQFKARKYIIFFLLFTQMVPMFIMLAPLYQMFGHFKLLNKPQALWILYTNMMIPFCSITLRGFFANIPRSIEESAMIDGCGRLRSIFLVVAPIMIGGITATFIYAFVNSWNEVFTAIMFIDDDKYRTIPVGLNALILKYDIKWGEMAAGTIMSIVPTVVLFSASQKYMIAGLAEGAVKG